MSYTRLSLSRLYIVNLNVNDNVNVIESLSERDSREGEGDNPTVCSQ